MSNSREPTSYDRQAKQEIERWKEPRNNLARRAGRIVTRPLEKGTELLMENTPLGAAVKGMVELLNDGAVYTVSEPPVYKRFGQAGHTVAKPEDVARLELQQVDEVVGFLSARYKVVAGSEGAVAGGAGTVGPWWGAAAIAVDLPVTVGLALRAVAEYATYYGFPPKSQGERAFALQVLQVASSAEDASKNAAMAELTRVGVMLGKGATWEQLNRASSVKVVQKVAESLSIRLTKAKLAYVVPVVGAAVGGGFNIHYLGKVTTAAYQSYRERFLLRAYGEDWR